VTNGDVDSSREPGTLRWAIAQANARVGADTILLRDGCIPPCTTVNRLHPQPLTPTPQRRLIVKINKLFSPLRPRENLTIQASELSLKRAEDVHGLPTIH
jgi:hypothetical protein